MERAEGRGCEADWIWNLLHSGRQEHRCRRQNQSVWMVSNLFFLYNHHLIKIILCTLKFSYCVICKEIVDSGNINQLIFIFLKLSLIHSLEREQQQLRHSFHRCLMENSVVENEDISSHCRTKISITDPDKLSHKIQNLLLPDTDYVFKIRAIYPDGPSVFSEPCIMKTLPDGENLLLLNCVVIVQA